MSNFYDLKNTLLMIKLDEKIVQTKHCQNKAIC